MGNVYARILGYNNLMEIHMGIMYMQGWLL